ncbi:MAG: PepSY domain-containing protein, partial [Rhodococcus sp. (in: high G+C Gram-positive bacteria)]|nr:PepSY domain-containing protein [Rhodococcus sp. (in: high G+C Gram-positive bacteria)]MDX5452993.1 PepSY domain-containing protein [Rhodococcus sp. (in: high G+C Gram-positive bacteria)]
VTVVVRGYVLWWRRRPTRGSAWSVGRAPSRGALRRIGAVPAVAIGIAAAVVGWFAPVLGLSLLAFLVVDTAVGWRSRGRA